MLNSLPNPKTSKRARVLKADIFRYTILLHKGGIYTDIDTAAVKKIDEWGEGAFDMVSSYYHYCLSTANLIFCS